MSSEGYEKHMPFILMSDCDQGKHKLEPRYDSNRVGDLFAKVYVCDICVVCGHTVTRTMSLKEKLEAGVMSIDEARVLLEAQFQVALEEFEAHVGKPVGDPQEAQGSRFEQGCSDGAPIDPEPPAGS